MQGRKKHRFMSDTITKRKKEEYQYVLAIKGLRVSLIGRPFPTGALMKSYRSACGYTENLFRNE